MEFSLPVVICYTLLLCAVVYMHFCCGRSDLGPDISRHKTIAVNGITYQH